MSDICRACGKYSDLEAVSRDETYTIRGREIVVRVDSIFCPLCREKYFADEQEQAVIDRIHEKFRGQYGLLTPEEIKEIRCRYGLSQTAFARLLGMGDKTISRYERGFLQDEAHELLIRCCEDASFVGKCLELFGHKLTERQKNKLVAALDGEKQKKKDAWDFFQYLDEVSETSDTSHFSGFKELDFRKFGAVAIWFSRKLHMTRTILNKLLFYTDFLYFSLQTVSLTGSCYRKAQFGPVPSRYDELLSWMENRGFIDCTEEYYANGHTGYHYSPGDNAPECDVGFSDVELEVLERVAEEFSNTNAKEISERSHREPAWRDTEDGKYISYFKAEELSLSIE